MADFLRASDERINWLRATPFILMHFAPLLVFVTGIHLADLLVCLALYYLRMFFISAGYHRYFAHRGYKLGRVAQFVMAFGGTMAAQKGVLWWAGYHRHHHHYSDTPKDIHSPLRGFVWSHVGWILCDKYYGTHEELIPDFAKFPELRWLDKHFLVPPMLLAIACFAFGGWSMLLVGFFLSTVLLYHATFFINSLAHVFGRRRYVTNDTSRNSMFLALMTLGEGWHNNHHYYSASARQGFFWWEIDVSYYVLTVLNWLGIARDLLRPPRQVLGLRRVRDGNFDIGMFQARWERAHRALTLAHRQLGSYADAKHADLAKFYEEKQQAMEELLIATKKAAEDMARLTQRADITH